MSTSTPTLVHAGTFRVVECTEHAVLGKGLSLKQAEDALTFYKARKPSARIAILKEWVEPSDSPSESDLREQLDLANGASPHVAEQKQPGKYDCHYDSYVHGDLCQWADGFGDVNEYGAYFHRIDLTEDIVPEHELIEMIRHYGTPYLLVQEDDRGFVIVVAFATEEHRDDEWSRLEADFIAAMEPWS